MITLCQIVLNCIRSVGLETLSNRHFNQSKHYEVPTKTKHDYPKRFQGLDMRRRETADIYIVNGGMLQKH